MSRPAPMALVLALAVVVCQACTVSPAAVQALLGPAPPAAQADPAVRNPIIASFTANPANTVVPVGQPITFQVVASDPGGQALQLNWTATGGTLSTDTGRLVAWTPPSAPGTYTIQVVVTNAAGGVSTGSQNLTVGNGQAVLSPAALPAAAAPVPAVPAPAVAGAPFGVELSFDGYLLPVAGAIVNPRGNDPILRGHDVEFVPWLKNAGSRGVAREDELHATMAAADPFVTVAGDAVTYPSIVPHDRGVPNIDGRVGGFEVKVSPDAPRPHDVAFVLHLGDRYGDAWDVQGHFTVQ